MLHSFLVNVRYYNIVILVGIEYHKIKCNFQYSKWYQFILIQHHLLRTSRHLNVLFSMATYLFLQRSFLFIWKTVTGRGRDRAFICLFTPQLAAMPSTWPLKSQDLPLGLPVVVRGHNAWAIICCHPRFIRREQELVLWYGMLVS